MRRVRSEAKGVSAEIQRADPAARRLALIGVVAMAGLGLIPIIWLQGVLDTISELRRTDPVEATRRMLGVTRLLAAATAVTCFVIAIWLAQLSFRIRTAGRFPLPGARVVRDTPVLRGAAAGRQARIALMVALALLISGVLVPALLLRLTHWLAPAAG